MKILIANNDYCANYYKNIGLARAFGYAGHNIYIWDINTKPAHDIFSEVEPDIFIGEAYRLNRALLKCIKARPGLRTILKAGDWGKFYDDKDEQWHEQYPILMASNEERDNVIELMANGAIDYLFVHYHPDYIEDTHGYWSVNGIKVKSYMNAADVFEYCNGEYREEFACDIGYIGGRWSYKSQTIDKYILPLCNPNFNLNIKIFGNTDWNIPQYCGHLPPGNARHLFKSSIICPNISEPHSQKYGFDIIERPFKIMAAKGFCISDYVEGLRKLFSEDELIMVHSTDEFDAAINHYQVNPQERHKFITAGYKKTIQNHTYFERAIEIFDNLKLDSSQLKEAKIRAIKELNL